VVGSIVCIYIGFERFSIGIINGFGSKRYFGYHINCNVVVMTVI
jgi:hypothetical protein